MKFFIKNNSKHTLSLSPIMDIILDPGEGVFCDEDIVMQYLVFTTEKHQLLTFVSPQKMAMCIESHAQGKMSDESFEEEIGIDAATAFIHVAHGPWPSPSVGASAFSGASGFSGFSGHGCPMPVHSGASGYFSESGSSGSSGSTGSSVDEKEKPNEVFAELVGFQFDRWDFVE